MPFPTRSLRFSPSFIQRAGRPATDPTEIPTVFDYDDPKAIARAEKAHRRMTANPDKLVFAWARYTTVAGWVLAGSKCISLSRFRPSTFPLVYTHSLLYTLHSCFVLVDSPHFSSLHFAYTTPCSTLCSMPNMHIIQ